MAEIEDEVIVEWQPVCRFCMFLDVSNPDGPRCPAFPTGIPSKVWQGVDPHVQPIEGQTGSVVFTPLDYFVSSVREAVEAGALPKRVLTRLPPAAKSTK